MSAVLMCARSDVARRWRQVVVLAFVVAVAGAVVLTATAGARRTASSFDRFVESTRAYDVLVFFRKSGASTVPNVRAIAGVEAAALVDVPAVQLADGTFLAAGAPADDVVFREIARTRIVDGRDTAAGAAEEIVVGEPLAQQKGIRVGDSIELVSFAPEQIQALIAEVGAPIPEPDGPRISMKVVGISRSPVDLSQQGDAGGILLLSHAFVDKYRERIGSYSDVVLVRLTDGSADVPRFVQQLRQTIGDDPESVIDEVEPTSVSTSGVRESIDVLAVALALFAAISGIAGVVVIGFVMARLITFGSEQREIWEALGLTRAQRAVAMSVPALGATLAGSALGAVGAWLASPLMPIGLARVAEPSPGRQFDVLVLGGGTAALIVALTTMTLLLAWWHARPATDRISVRRSVLSRALETVSFNPALGVGLRAALEPRRGRGAIPVRSTLVAVIVAVLGVVSVSMFGPSLDRLASEPSLFGVGWDVAVDDTLAERPDPDRPCSGLLGTRVEDEPGIEAVGAICNLTVEVDGHPISAFGYMPMRGSIPSTVLEGHAPQADDEIALGSDTFATVTRRIGDQVSVEGPRGAAAFRIVGRVVIPSLGDSQAVADGAILTGAGLDRLDDPAAELSHAWVVATIAHTGDRRAIEENLAKLPDVGDPETIGVEGPRLPLEVRRLQQVDHLPIVLAGVLALLGAAALGYALATSIRRRRSEHAVLKTLGFTRRQLAAAIAWQATTVAGISIAIGIPAGIVVGRLIWRAVSDNTGLAYAPEVPLLVLVGTALAALILANLAASVAGRAAARVSPATILQAE
jgi:ABC-type antimicrobial peptide transport system permease subunit